MRRSVAPPTTKQTRLTITSIVEVINFNMASGDGSSLLRQADELYSQQKYREALELLEPESAESEDAELLWRMMRLYYRLGSAAKDDQTKAGELAKKAYEISERGLEIDENSFGIQKVEKLKLFMMCRSICDRSV